MDEIIKIITRRNKERQALNKDDIKKICGIIIKGKNYQEYVESVNFAKVYSKDEDAAGMYDGEKLFFYSDGLEKFAERNYESVDEQLDGTKIDFYNFFALVTIFHELAHVRQSVMQDFKKNKEGQLYTICEKLHSIDDFYEENYKYDLREINAWALGFLNAVEMYNAVPKSIITPLDLSVYKNFGISKMLSGYSISGKNEYVISPAEKLFENADKYNMAKLGVNKDNFKKLISSGEDYTLYRKLCMGLHMSFDSFAYINMLLQCSNSGDNFSFVKKLQHHK